jgi:hypothetical protein
MLPSSTSPGASSTGIAQIGAALARRAQRSRRVTWHLVSHVCLARADAGTTQTGAHPVLTLCRSDSEDRAPHPFMATDVVDRFGRGQTCRLRIAHPQLVAVFQAAA